MISPLVTQLTYEGLIDEMFGIRNASVRLPASRFAGGGEGGEEEAEEAAETDQEAAEASSANR